MQSHPTLFSSKWVTLVLLSTFSSIVLSDVYVDQHVMTTPIEVSTHNSYTCRLDLSQSFEHMSYIEIGITTSDTDYLGKEKDHLVITSTATDNTEFVIVEESFDNDNPMLSAATMNYKQFFEFHSAHESASPLYSTLMDGEIELVIRTRQGSFELHSCYLMVEGEI